mgnify:CR=1 FL=1
MELGLRSCARIGRRSSERVGFGAASTVLSGTIVADARRKSLSMHIAMLAERAHCGHCDVLFETKDKLTLERFKLFNRRLDSGTEKELVRATVKVASSSTQACGRERVLGFLLWRKKKGQKGSCTARY